MAVFRSVVQAPMLSMFDTQHHSPLCGGIAGQFIRDHHARRDALLLAQQAFGRFRVAAAQNQNVEHDTVLINRLPEPVPFTRNAVCDLVEVPSIS